MIDITGVSLVRMEVTSLHKASRDNRTFRSNTTGANTPKFWRHEFSLWFVACHDAKRIDKKQALQNQMVDRENRPEVVH